MIKIKLLLTSLMFLVTLMSFGQSDFKWDQIDSTSKTKDEIYSITKIYIGESWKSAQDVIQNDDKEGGMILVRGIFYFNRYERVDGFESDTNNIVTSFYEQGNIERYGNVIKISKTSETDIYFIQNVLYKDTEQTYIFTCKKVIVEFSVTDRTIEVKQMNEDSKEIFHINSTIKTNW